VRSYSGIHGQGVMEEFLNRRKKLGRRRWERGANT